MTTTVEISLQPVKSSLTNDMISVGDDVVYVTMCTKTSYIQRGKFLGTRETTRTFSYRWSPERTMTRKTTTYLVERADGRKTALHYARMAPASSPITALVGTWL